MESVSRVRYLRLKDTPFEAREFSLLWLIALATYGVGDIVTTLTILYYERRFDEANALLVASTDALGHWGLVLPKLAVFFLCLGICVYGARVGDKVLYYLPPVTLSVIGAFATAFNLRLFVG
ncbi:uncharacterized protein HfgLR_22375 (plasmid) [Haloferax gibbonsii]|uniref:DUF5658 domain-containing protein n=1 Tax=Haloferax gibbonsii TaxID=35746 RepID=A0A871BLW1_HALGI|nr:MULTISPECIES: hypothetical protein [Haloferax]QOS13683.1 uncharacterized protein HfgLR_22375 [Haloferax gibbonsii]